MHYTLNNTSLGLENETYEGIFRENWESFYVAVIFISSPFVILGT